ncbi:MAG TPA: hypothetical protein VGN93_31015 [Shinella sp.]|jgi:hypothetical protein|uniref:hypothetical protein n=1 Tax=Shinella sp. TaxID=1870904 RepID=UPI002E0F6EB3|nr:hypothetical protein [Shinella sp.]
MAVSHEPVFAQAGRTVCATATAAKTTYNDIANAVLLCTGGADGSIFKSLSAMPLATVTASKLMLFHVDAAGTVVTLVDSVLMGAHTIAVTTATPISTFTGFSEIRLKAGEKLYVASGVALAGGISFTGQVEDF